jgi:hypothetical protein
VKVTQLHCPEDYAGKRGLWQGSGSQELIIWESHTEDTHENLAAMLGISFV